MGNRNAEGYPDPTASEAIRRAGGNRIDYSKFRTYRELQDYTIKTVDRVTTRAQADKYIREKMPRESDIQSKIIKWIHQNFPDAFVWKAAAGPYARGGIPDICCIIGGRFYGLEVKRPFIGVVKPVQEQTIKKIRKAGGVAEVVTSEKDAARILLPEREGRHGNNDHTKETN